uniref:UBA domain-containing protein n=1 Tax=Rhizochromulina marina TaxID=1034831 RepID=A0A7S2WEB5_9STRA|mmetsp:Transcript_21763/g.63329  ORF Transcript_21763/g.63329 Transcript_21763/m.63329 type:complete len:146 (+) Transcript_21763:36-473(+)
MASSSLAQLDARIEQLFQMGFPVDTAERALRRANNDYNLAVTMLTTGNVPEEDAFDILAQAVPSQTGDAPLPKPAKNGVSAEEKDHFREGLSRDAPASAVLDSRVQQLMEMGFTAKQAEEALKVCNNDMDSALELLTKGVDELSA